MVLFFGINEIDHTTVSSCDHPKGPKKSPWCTASTNQRNNKQREMEEKHSIARTWPTLPCQLDSFHSSLPLGALQYASALLWLFKRQVRERTSEIWVVRREGGCVSCCWYLSILSFFGGRHGVPAALRYW